MVQSDAFKAVAGQTRRRRSLRSTSLFRTHRSETVWVSYLLEQRPGRPDFAGLDAIPVGERPPRERVERRAPLAIDRQKAPDQRRHDCLGGAVGAVVAFDCDAVAVDGQCRAMRALRARFAEDALAETIHHTGLEATAAGHQERMPRAPSA